MPTSSSSSQASGTRDSSAAAVLIVIENVKRWPLAIPGVKVVSARNYLLDPAYSDLKRAKVFNLCRSYRYQSTGYYVSLLAAARGHRPLPSVETIQDFKHSAMLRIVSDDLYELIQRSLSGIRSAERYELSVYFGRNMAKRYLALAQALFNQFPAPFLRATFKWETDEWRLESLRPIAGGDIPDAHRDFVIEQAHRYFTRPTSGKALRDYRYDLAILWSEKESNAPSDERAIKNFVKAARELGIDATVIEPDDYGRLSEFDALFIRETTAVNHHTYRFSRRAAREGLVVIDDPESIVRCSNKVYQAEIFARHNIACPKTVIVARDNMTEAERVGFPAVVKRPDSSFSQGVMKAHDAAELNHLLNDLFQKTELAVVQEFMRSDFDWRVGVLGGRALYACKYFMARGDWRIQITDAKGKRLFGKYETLPVEEAPHAAVALAVKAARLIGDGFYGVDIKECGGHYYVMEVNDNPSIDSQVEDAFLKDKLYRAVMQLFLDRLEARGRNRAHAR